MRVLFFFFRIAGAQEKKKLYIVYIGHHKVKIILKYLRKNQSINQSIAKSINIICSFIFIYKYFFDEIIYTSEIVHIIYIFCYIVYI